MEEDLKLEDLKQENCKSNCINCDYQETTQGCIKVHQQAKHETCDLCGKQLTTNGDITRHKQVTHDSFNHFCSFTKFNVHHNLCDFCEYSLIQKETLKVHEAAVHNKIETEIAKVGEHACNKSKFKQQNKNGETCSFCEHLVNIVNWEQILATIY